MANVVNVWKMMDGPSHVTLHCWMKSDPLDGELTNYVLLDPSVDLVPPMAKQQDLILKQIWYEVGGFAVTFAFETQSGSWPFWTLTPGASLHHDWRFFGGIRDHADAVLGYTATGRLLMSTQGFLQTEDSGGFVLWLEKRDRPNPQPD
jgi:hypothetical protein